VVVEEATLVRGDLRVVAAAGTELELEADVLRIDEGTVTVDGADAFAMRTPRGDLVAHGGPSTVRVTEVAVLVEVIAGHVVMTEPTGLVHVIEAATLRRFEGARGDDGGASPRTTSAAELLARAQRERAAGKSGAAVKTYRELVRRHSGSSEAHSALVSLGQLELDRGHPQRAARAFRRYLGRGGVLAEEARYGEIRALRDLGRAADERRAIEEFLRRHPASPHRASLQRRLGDLPP
jgi:outer membrane protein assembly factor BamD (BamD/ComL family)